MVKRSGHSFVKICLNKQKNTERADQGQEHGMKRELGLKHRWCCNSMDNTVYVVALLSLVQQVDGLLSSLLLVCGVIVASSVSNLVTVSL